MANAYSIQRNRGGWINPTDQDFTLKALMFKQQKYDANQAKVQSIIEQYKSLQLARGVDRDYLNQRLQYLIDNANQLGPQDLSSNAVTQSIQYHLSQTLDDNVMTAIQETAKIKTYQQEVNKLKEKNPELYNALNDAYALAPAQEYLQNTEVGAKIKGNLTYTPYKDIEGEIQKTLLDIQTKAKDGSYEYEVAPGKLAKVTVNGKSESELRQIALGLMGDKYNQQFTINAWGKYGGFKNLENTTAGINDYYSKMLNAHDKDIEEKKAQLSGGRLSSENEAKMRQEIKNLENQKLLIQNSMAAFQKDPVSGLIAMEKDGVATRLGKSLGLLRTESTEYKKDDYYFAMQDYNLNVDKFNWDKQVDQATLAFNQQKWEEEKQLKINEQNIALAKAASGSGSSSGSGSGGQNEDRGQIIRTNGETESDETRPTDFDQVSQDIYKSRKEMYNTGRLISQNIINIASGRDRNVDTETRSQATQLINNYKARYGALPSDASKMTAQQVSNFMNLYSRADAYEGLAYLPMGGSTSITGENSGKVSLKSKWTDLVNMDRFKTASFQKAVNAAKADMRRAGKDPNNFRESQGFKEYLATAIPMEKNNHQFTIVGATDKDISSLNGLLAARGLDAKGAGMSVKGGSISFRLTGDGNVALKYQAKGKGEDKESVLQSTAEAVVPLSVFKQFFPNVDKEIDTSGKRAMFTWQNMGSREIVSPRISMLSPNSKYITANTQEASTITSNKADLQLLTADGVRNVMGSLLGGYVQPQEKAKSQVLLNVLSDPTFMNYLNVVVQYVPSYNGTGNADLLVRLVDNRTNKTVITQNLGAKESADDIIKLNERFPQILYSKLILGELNKMIQTSPNEVKPTEGIKYMLNLGHARL